METPIDTGFKDKSGRTIYVGDVLQYRLSLSGKTSGPSNTRVIVFGKNFHLVPEFRPDDKYGGVRLTAEYCKRAVVIKSDYIRR